MADLNKNIELILKELGKQKIFAINDIREYKDNKIQIYRKMYVGFFATKLNWKTVIKVKGEIVYRSTDKNSLEIFRSGRWVDYLSDVLAKKAEEKQKKSLEEKRLREELIKKRNFSLIDDSDIFKLTSEK